MQKWLVTVLIVLFFIALAITVWGFISALNYKKRNNLIPIFKNKKCISYNQTFKINEGVFALYIRQINKNEFIFPIYIFSSSDFIESKQKIIYDIENEVNLKIAEYLKFNNLKIKDIVFYQLEEMNDIELLNQWIEKTQSKVKGFNY